MAIKKVASFAQPPTGKKLAISTSSNAPEASIATWHIVEEGNIASSPSPLVKGKKSANKYLFARGKVLPFASHLHMPSCDEHFQ